MKRRLQKVGSAIVVALTAQNAIPLSPDAATIEKMSTSEQEATLPLLPLPSIGTTTIKFRLSPRICVQTHITTDINRLFHPTVHVVREDVEAGYSWRTIDKITSRLQDVGLESHEVLEVAPVICDPEPDHNDVIINQTIDAANRDGTGYRVTITLTYRDLLLTDSIQRPKVVLPTPGSPPPTADETGINFTLADGSPYWDPSIDITNIINKMMKSITWSKTSD